MELGMGFTDSWILISGITVILILGLLCVIYYIHRNKRGRK